VEPLFLQNNLRAIAAQRRRRPNPAAEIQHSFLPENRPPSLQAVYAQARPRPQLELFNKVSVRARTRAALLCAVR
jgi:hypothetical protein